MFVTRSGLYSRRMYRDRNGAIALFTVLVSPPLLMVLGLAIEVSRWTVVKLELQRAADQAAIAGANQFYAVQHTSTAASVAANAAASVAELNGVSGAASRSWNNTTRTLTDNQITVVIGPGLRNEDNTGVQVTVSRVVPLLLAKLLTADTTRTISASAWSELNLAQACLLALGTNGAGISMQGNPNLTLSGCSVRSNSTISTGGSATISAQSLWARSTISGGGITGTQHPNSGTVPDPYASDAPIVTAFSRLSPGTGEAISVKSGLTKPLSTGTYSNWGDIKGRLALDSGIYYVNGDISLGAHGSITGSNVTIVTSGRLIMDGGSSINLSAATTIYDPNGAIPGVVFAGNSTNGSEFGGNSESKLSGVVYYPNGTMSFRGTPQAGSNGCLELIANSIVLQGNSSMSSNCDDFDPHTFGDVSPLGLVK